MTFIKHIAYIFFTFVSIQISAQSKNQIEIINTNTLEFDKSSGIDAKKLIGNVQFKHENAVMFCDSAYFYTEKNTIDAFGHVTIHQGDTLHLYGETLNYNGNTRVAQVRKNVRLLDKETELTTDYLDFKIAEDIGYYINGGRIINAENKLSSDVGYYYAKEKIFFYRKNVIIVNPKYTIKSDTLKYNTVNRTAYFYGPTNINSNENLIYCENGWYNTKTNISQFNKNAYLKSDKKLLKGDSLYYERNNGLGRAFNNIWLVDSLQSIILSGNYAEYFEKPERALITDSAQFMQFSNDDTLFLHADTLRSFTTDTINNDKEIKAYRQVKLYKEDLQGKCDSMVYKTGDSTMRLYTSPILWSGGNQITADYIEIHMANQKLNTANFYSNSFIISKEDSNKFNQIKGKNMVGLFNNNELSRLNVLGNGQTIYFAKDKNTIIGMNKAIGSDLIVKLKDRKIKKIVFITKPEATLFPIHKVLKEDMTLKDFKWLDKQRPKNKKEIFYKD